jgi:hypothetical protein
MKFQTLSIVVGNEACNASCPFCIAKMTPKITPNHSTNFRNFNACCRLAVAGGVTTALITGKGETTLFPDQCHDYILKASKYFPIIELQTNGLVFGWEIDKWCYTLDKWNNLANDNNAIFLVALSVVHYKDELNKEIYTPDRDYPSLEKRIEILHNLGIPVRLSCIGLKRYIDSVYELENLISFARKNNVEQLTWRCVTVPSFSVNKEVEKNAKELQIPSFEVSLLNQYIKDTGTLLLSLPHGAEVFDVKGQNICMGNCLTHTPDPDQIRQLIYVDGHIKYSWQYKGATIV